MKKRGIGFRVTASLVAVSLLTSVLSILFFYSLTRKAFNDYVRENRTQIVLQVSRIVGDIYDQAGWVGVQQLLEGISYMRRMHSSHMGMGPGSMGGMGLIFLMQNDIIVTDASGRVVASTRGFNGQARTASITAPVHSGGEIVGFVTVRSPLKPAERSLEFVFYRTLSSYSLFSVAFGLGLALLIGALVSRRLTEPIKQLSAAVKRFSKGERDVKITLETGDELSSLAEDFNAMAEKIRKSEELRRNLTADIAHELRTPIAIIQGTLESIQEGVLEPTPALMLSLQEEVSRMTRLIKDLSDLSLVEAGKLELNRIKIFPAELAGKFIHFKAEAEAKGIRFDINFPRNLPAVYADPTRLVQIITNLLSNALKHTSSGRIELSAEKAEGGVVFKVQDTGSGIKKEDLPYIFERFYRAEKSRSRKTGGTGLGLAITKGLVEAHGGRIWVESREGEGSVFSFFIPSAT
ncbi:sensor histidine kinase [Thermosediminibacter oceani]|uniref:histidine kinase n=1 Tax=Thermosediminibacter oceani (strain ATCC BAA-1034 / DSM 16646 / JW/IW-1228P) TaxID=555079 RepID=D9RZU8_THEOJ|nr:ATP-binding protein [Thermosediminibacter oceani]ADL08725.1 integral membrane sensor signal transduction histidine kinase [Thermosediminibacter oceani DSM 16646]